VQCIFREPAQRKSLLSFIVTQAAEMQGAPTTTSAKSQLPMRMDGTMCTIILSAMTMPSTTAAVVMMRVAASPLRQQQLPVRLSFLT